MPKLLEYQQKAVEKIINVGKGRMLVWVPMGGGKTPIASDVAARLSCRRIVIVCKDSGSSIWTRKTTDPDKLLGRDWLEHFTGRKVVVHDLTKMNSDERKAAWALKTSPEEVHVWVVIYNTFSIDNGVVSKTVRKKSKKEQRPIKYTPSIIPYNARWDMLILDECKRITNKDSAAASAAEQFLYKQHIPYFLPMSGTPGDRGPKSFWMYWRCINKQIFSSYWSYIEHFYTTMESPFGGTEIVERRHDTMAEWDRVMDKYAIVVPQHEVDAHRPPLTREKMYVKFTSVQKRLYDDISKEMVSLVDNELIVAQNPMVKMLRLRQILVCPQILGDFNNQDGGHGGAIANICDVLDEGTERDRHCVIFTPFTAAIEPFTIYLRNRDYTNVFALRGGISSLQQDEQIREWRRTKGVMICSIRYAEAFSLEPADNAYFIGYEYSPDDNDQAERRLSRLTSQHPVTCRYVTYGTSIDERMTDIICIKRERIDLSLPSNLRRIILGDQNLTK